MLQEYLQGSLNATLSEIVKLRLCEFSLWRNSVHQGNVISPFMFRVSVISPHKELMFRKALAQTGLFLTALKQGSKKASLNGSEIEIDFEFASRIIPVGKALVDESTGAKFHLMVREHRAHVTSIYLMISAFLSSRA